jgi:DNA-binding XRE family transcriptional regulator
MNREEIISVISSKLKLIRIEAGYTQDQMAYILGISKKTLIQIEKDRTTANWTTITALCLLFRKSEIIKYFLGDCVEDILETIAHETVKSRLPSLPFEEDWDEIQEVNGFRLQQNRFSKHYRIVNKHNKQILSTIHRSIAFENLKQVITSNSNVVVNN